MFTSPDEHLLGHLMNLPLVGMAVISADTWHWLHCNQRLREILGYLPGELECLTWLDITHPEDRDAAARRLRQLTAGESDGYLVEKRLVRKDGTPVHARVDVRCVRRSEGSPEYLLAAVQDITKQRAAERSARATAARLEHLMRVSPAVIYTLQPAAEGAGAGAVAVSVSESVQRLLGYTVEEALQPGWWAAHLHPEDRDAAERRFATLAAGADLSHDYRFLHKDGSVMWVRDVLRVVPADGPHGEEIVGAWIDISDRVHDRRRIEAYAARLERAVMATVETISHMVALRDPYTAGHERRVGELSAAIGAELGLDDSEQQGLRVAGGVHDVGKITVPAEILTKPGRLTEPEYELMKGHVERGYEILRSVDFPWPVAEAVRQHHERMDGSGYPRGLKGDEILLAARIIAVADTVASMAYHRPYRPALGIDRALAEIEAGAGRTYDGAVVGACVRLFRERGYVMKD